MLVATALGTGSASATGSVQGEVWAWDKEWVQGRVSGELRAWERGTEWAWAMEWVPGKAKDSGAVLAQGEVSALDVASVEHASAKYECTETCHAQNMCPH